MTVAVNPDTGAAVYLDGDTGQWIPAQVATNPDTGESVAFDGSAWAPIKLPAPPQNSGRTLGQRFSDLGNDLLYGPAPPGISIEGAIKKGIQAFTSPLPQLPPSFGPGYDELADPAVKRSFNIAFTGMLPSAGGASRLGVESGALGTNFVPKMAPVAPTVENAAAPVLPEVVQRAADIPVSLPRYMVDDNRFTQGLAAGLQNIPGAGDKIAKAAGDVATGLGNAVTKVQEGFGTGSPAVAGSYAKDAITDWITGGSKQVANRVYDTVDSLVNPNVTSELPNTIKAAQSILTQRANARIPGQSAAVNAIMDAATAPGGVNYAGIKGLRSFLGEMSPQEMVANGLKEAEVKQLYGALTTDLRGAITNAGGQPALTAFNKANQIYENIVSRRNDLARIVGVRGDAAPEAVFSRLVAMAGSKNSADIGRLMQARKAMGPDAWNEVASAVVSKLGRDTRGEFDIGRFLTAYGNLSDAGRSALFKSTGRDNLGRSLDDVAFVTKSIEAKLKQFYNPSGTGRSLASTATVIGLIHNPVSTLMTLVGGDGLAKLLTQPATAQSMANWLKAYNSLFTSPNAPSAVGAASQKFAGLIAKTIGGNPRALSLQLQFGMPPVTGAAAEEKTNPP